MMLRERGAAGDVQLLDRVDELQAVALGYRPDTLGLLASRPEPIAVAISDARAAEGPAARRTEDRLSVEEGRPAPDFTLNADSGESVTLSALRGSPVILYFYPKDDTPGCTAQACGIRDAWKEFEAAGAVVLGVSPDGEESHAKFKQKYDLPFTLLADTDHAVADEYGVWGEKSYAGKTYMGVDRSTFVIGADGNVAKVFRQVKPAEHADQVLEALGQEAGA
jgi:thioredoxin-dependent peroxiredoxin